MNDEINKKIHFEKKVERFIKKYTISHSLTCTYTRIECKCKQKIHWDG